MLRSVPIGSSPARARPDPAAAARAGDRADLAREIADDQRSLGALDPAVRSAEDLAREDAAVIVTGQQPGLLGGPLLTLQKALSAVAWARTLEEETGRRVVPLFWVASEDHDLIEANQVTILTREDELRTLRLALDLDGRMLSEVDPGPGADALLEAAADHLPASAGTEKVLASLRESRVPSLGRWFAGIISRWLSGEGLVVAEARLFRRAAAGVLRFERENPGRIAAACGPGPIKPSATPFFAVRDGRRERVRSPADLPADPGDVSWDVVTRVLAQNLALPVAGHVVGPSELLYCRQIVPAHDLLGIPAPPLLPRAGLTLVEGKVERSLAAFGTTLTEVLAKGEEALSGEIEPGEFDRALTRLEDALKTCYPEIRTEAGRMDEVLERKAEGAERELLKAIARLRDHGRRALERVTGRDRERRRKVLAHLLPSGEPQDRVLSPLPFLARHGFGLIRRLLEVVQAWPDGRRAVFLAGKES